MLVLNLPFEETLVNVYAFCFYIREINRFSIEKDIGRLKRNRTAREKKESGAHIHTCEFLFLKIEAIFLIFNITIHLYFVNYLITFFTYFLVCTELYMVFLYARII